LARAFDIMPTSARTAAAMAQRILAGEGAWAWDARQIDHAANEAPMAFGGQSLRLDRLVRRRATAQSPAHWWVLDYKSAAQPERQPELIAQLRHYRKAVQAQLAGEGVSAAFLTGDGRLVVVDGELQKPAVVSPHPSPSAPQPAPAQAKPPADAPHDTPQRSLF